MLEKPLDSPGLADIERLVELSVAESKVIEYKEVLPGTRDSDTKKFLQDVCSFANALGGHIVYGVSERSQGESEHAI